MKLLFTEDLALLEGGPDEITKFLLGVRLDDDAAVHTCTADVIETWNTSGAYRPGPRFIPQTPEAKNYFRKWRPHPLGGYKFVEGDKNEARVRDEMAALGFVLASEAAPKRAQPV